MTRDRGHYGPLDRDRHWAVGWGADRAKDYVRDRTIGAALRPIMPIVDDVSRARQGAQRWWNASRVIGGRDAAERPAAQIGQELFQAAGAHDQLHPWAAPRQAPAQKVTLRAARLVKPMRAAV